MKNIIDFKNPRIFSFYCFSRPLAVCVCGATFPPSYVNNVLTCTYCYLKEEKRSPQTQSARGRVKQ